MKIEFTDEQRDNLATFLQRVSLTGKEVPAYIAIVEAINKASLGEVEEVKPNKPKK